ncbi:TetR/AcrR family transcriptional regulator [Actinokineospora globicatena]|uniref:TetR family transcriptional regulator n=1 Tax=Actinokineospora globicatena TaxID=103729 RepID=A0A9W6QJ24_9PSEU|nr:TetR/AcrR family transcriptional regulator [Actinokineospora globicatena]MCP2302735.1 transcriptional regulator, TetR family [Actinokineospora globicatena]GLW75575.1 TetR family transcriptional regulator [Actinokineospora globicatena]GLW82415.1 TetR family transcriptional regulator [Actinokineospora globicatena]GLW91358.1 TetR family transcriptional regulator [Actinokineospora globicatena]
MGEAVREPRQDRSRATRGRLLAAAVDCLAEVGWSGSTVSVVAERAGVSRGAAQHHFPTREDLFTAAIGYVTDERVQFLRSALPSLPPGPDRTRFVVEAIGEMYAGKLFAAALQLWVAAASDEQLRVQVVPLEARVGREAHRLTVDALGVDEARPGVREAVQATLDLARGLGLANLLTDDTRRRQRVLAEWTTVLAAKLA